MEKAFQLLERVGLIEHVDKRADALSGGQRQRVGIARALEQDPELLLVDEPTASLDPKTSRQIMRLIAEICAERQLATVINIHDVALAQMFVARIIGLRAGKIVYDGPPTGLSQDTLVAIYGEEDWTALSAKYKEDAEDAALAAAHPHAARATSSRPAHELGRALAQDAGGAPPFIANPWLRWALYLGACSTSCWRWARST